jgi:uncharacterized protein YdhG (YjbR/CyaY superfamily)
VVYKADNLYSRQAVKEELNTVMAEIKAEQSNTDQFVKVNYGTELLKVSPEGERLIHSSVDENVSAPVSQAMQSMAPKDLDFKIKYIDAGSHPISGRKMFSAHLILDNDVVYRADNTYSRQAVKEELNTVMAEIKAEQRNADQFVKLNYGTELLKVSPEGERLIHSSVDENVSAPVSQAMQSMAPKDLDFKIKYIDAGSHPISGRKMFSAHLILDNDVVYKADNLYSRQAVKEELNTVMAEIKAEQRNADQFVKLNYGTELLKVSPEGERLIHSSVDENVSAPVSQAMQSMAPKDLDFKIKYIDAGSHPISGRKMFSAHLILDNDVVYKADNLYSRQAVKEELNTVMAEIKAEQSNTDQFVKVNYGTELLKVSPEGERLIHSSVDENVSAPVSQAMQSMAPKDLDFKIKYIDAGSHPISGRKMFSAHLILDNDVVYRADNTYSRQAVKEELNTVMAEIKAEQRNADQFVKLNYGTELLKVSPEGERLIHSSVDENVSAPVSQAMQSMAPKDLDFKIKYIDAGSHPISGRKMFSAHLILDNDVVYKADNLYSRQASKEELNTVMAEIKAEQRNADQFVKLNYGTELLKVTSTGERIKQSITIAN